MSCSDVTTRKLGSEKLAENWPFFCVFLPLGFILFFFNLLNFYPVTRFLLYSVTRYCVTLFSNTPQFSPWRRFVFKPKYWAICLNIYIFCSILLFTSSSPCCKDQFAVSYFSFKFKCTDPGLQLGDPAPLIGLFLWTFWHFIHFEFFSLICDRILNGVGMVWNEEEKENQYKSAIKRKKQF